MKPPVPQPIFSPQEEIQDTSEKTDRHQVLLAFWDALLKSAREESDLHENVSPSRHQFVGVRSKGQWWNYVVLQDETRVELYIDSPDAEQNKAVFDSLSAQQEAIESAFGGELRWQRLDNKRASRISYSVQGGWADENTWPEAIKEAVAAMGRFYSSLASHVEALMKDTA